VIGTAPPLPPTPPTPPPGPGTGLFELRPFGSTGNDVPDLVYDPGNGRITIDRDEGPSIGLFQLISQSGIFIGDPAALPADGLFGVDNDYELGKAAFSSLPSLELGTIAEPGITTEYVLRDIHTALVSQGLGFQNVALELISFAAAPSSTSAGGGPELLYNPATGNITLVAHDQGGIGLFRMLSESGIFTGDPARLPAEGQFAVDYDYAVARGEFSPVTVLDLGNIAAPGLTREFLAADVIGYVGSGLRSSKPLLSLRVVPEPASALLTLLAVLTFGGRIHRG
jgi:hypothetical protein